VPKHYNPQRDIDLYLTIADTGTELDKKIFEEDTKIERLGEEHVEDVSKLEKEIKDLDKNKHTYSKNLQKLDKYIHVADTYSPLGVTENSCLSLYANTVRNTSLGLRFYRKILGLSVYEEK